MTRPVQKSQVVAALEEIGRYLELLGENRFKAQAYERAARSLEQVSGDLAELSEAGKLTSVPHVGKGIAPVVDEILRTGTTRTLEDLRKQFPPGVLDLMRVPALTVKRIRALYEYLGVASLEELESACADGSLVRVPGFGKKTAETLCESLRKFLETPEQFLLHDAVPVAERLAAMLAEIDGVERVGIAGAVRRRVETVGRIDLVVAGSAPEAILEAFREHPALQEGRGEDNAWIARVSTIPVRIVVSAVPAFPEVLVQETGSGEWLTRNAPSKKLRTRKPRGHEPADLPWFEAAGLPWTEPELREDEVDPPESPLVLIRREDLTGTFHAHTTWSDGRHSVADMIDAAAVRGLQYLGLSDHSRSAAYAGGLTPDRLRLQQSEIRSVAERAPIRVFLGSEVDILADGDLDYEPATLRDLDFVVASVHSRFGMDVDEMTERIVRATENRYTTFLGHLSGRKLLVRDPYALDYRRIFEAAAANGVIIELNGNPQRLDVDWRWIRAGLDAGVLFSIHPDAHSTGALDHLTNGVWNGRKGGLEPRHVFNARPLEQVEEYLETRRGK